MKPFLEQFFETRGEHTADACGTSTFTKTRENGDTDYQPLSGRSPIGIALGTQTLTETREQADADETVKRSRTSAAALGTQTGTAKREESDADYAPHNQSAAALLGTRTGTRARENDDADVAPEVRSMWHASIL